MALLKGMTVKLHIKKQTGADGFGAPTYTDTVEDVDNVLIAPVSSAENIDNTSLYGKAAVYQLAIPKGDTHDWQDTEVEFFGQTWKTFGFAYAGMDGNIPGPWNAKVQVERNE